MRLRCIGIVAALAAASPIAAAASDTDDALRLATRIASYKVGFPAVALHAAPRPLPSGVPLPHATLLGSVVERDRRESATPGAPPLAIPSPYGTTMLFFDATDEREAVLRDYAAVLQSAGWKSPGNLRLQRPYVLGGLPLPPQIEQWCAPDRRTAVITQRADDPKGIDLTIVTSERAGESPCGPSTTAK
jgi:hypothetical protein